MLSTIKRRLRTAPDARRQLSSSATARSSAAPAPTLGNRPFRVGIIGGGPAGFYAASRLLGLPGSEQTKVDLFELLPTPFGLARFGVAPDHPEVKNCEHKFEETARDPRFRYFGNVQVGGVAPSPSSPSSSTSTVVPNLSPSPLAAQITLSDLQPHYDAILLTYGASLDRPLGIPGEDTLTNVLSARSFINWYNGHPYHSALLAPLIDLSKLEHVTVVGQGNVALDVARILLKDPAALEEFDVPEGVLNELRRSRVKRVEIVGRRGPLQLACTTKEVRELMNLPGVGFETDVALLKEAVVQVEANPGMDMARMRKRALGLLDKGSKTKMSSAERSWSFEFLKSPLELLPANPSVTTRSSDTLDLLAPPSRIGAVRYGINELVGSGDPSHLSARATGQSTTSTTDMVLKSVGYRSIGLPGLPFDERRGIVRNEEGRVTDEAGQPVPGLYTSGWLARGPNGVIATTMFDAFATADLLAADLSSSSTSEARPDLPIEQLRGGRQVVSWEDWEKLDREERRRGQEKGKLREKMTEVKEMLEVLA